jgi:hypothetical protein
MPSSPTFYAPENLGCNCFTTPLASIVYAGRMGMCYRLALSLQSTLGGFNIHDCVFMQDLTDIQIIQTPIAAAPAVVSGLHYV